MNNIFQYQDNNNLVKKFFLLGLISTVLSYLGYLNDIEHFYHSYLVSFVFWMTLSVGCMFFVLMHYAMNATWSVAMRRIAETAMSLIPYVCLFSIPLYFGMDYLYEWTHLNIKQPYLSKHFFLARTGFYFIAWIIISRVLYYHSVRYSSFKSLKTLRKWSGVGTVVFALTISFAAFDWLMTLDPHWYSTMFGVYIFSGSFLVSIAFITIILIYLRNSGVLYNEINIEHYHDLGRIMFGFTVFWAYIAGFQYYLIWYGNLPEETGFLLIRLQEEPWMDLSFVVLLLTFLTPFPLLLFQWVKRTPPVLAVVSLIIVVGMWLERYILVVPSIWHEPALPLGWIELGMLVGFFALFTLAFLTFMRAFPLSASTSTDASS